MLLDAYMRRREVKIPAIGSVTVAVNPETGEAGFICLSCDSYILWNNEHSLYECIECGYDLTLDEANDLCTRHIYLVSKLITEVKKERGWLWRLVHWFAGRKFNSTS